MKKILIIGGAGFIGSHLVDIFLKEGHETCVYDDFSVGRESNLQKHELLRIVKGDILDPAALAECFSVFQPDFVYHLAAIHFIPRCESDPQSAIRINIEGTQNVLSTCALYPPKGIVVASTGAIYDISDQPLHEQLSPLRPLDIYGVTKYTCEHLCRLYAAKHDSQSLIIARIFNAIGARETNPHLVPEILAQLEAGEETVQLGNLEPKRDYICVKDIAGALYEIHKHIPSVASPDVVNIGTGVEYSVREVIDTIAEILQKTITIEQDPSRMRKVDRLHQLADTAKLHEVYDFKTQFSLYDALSMAVEDQKNNVII